MNGINFKSNLLVKKRDFMIYSYFCMATITGTVCMSFYFNDCRIWNMISTQFILCDWLEIYIYMYSMQRNNLIMIITVTLIRKKNVPGIYIIYGSLLKVDTGQWIIFLARCWHLIISNSNILWGHIKMDGWYKFTACFLLRLLS